MKKWRWVIIVLVLAIIGIFVLPIRATDSLRNYSWQIIKPVSFVFRSTIGKTFPFLRDIFQFRSIVRQNSNLVRENMDLQSRLAKLSEVDYENEILKKELGFMNNQDQTKMLPAAVVGQSNGYLRSLVIDKGEKAGLIEGSAVVSQGILVGVVTKVRQDNSDVTLITDFNSLVPVMLSTSRGTGLLRGGLQGLAIEDIPLNVGIKKSEDVLTSGLGGQIPPGILVGKTAETISKEGEIFQKVAVNSSIDFSRLEVLFVVKK